MSKKAIEKVESFEKWNAVGFRKAMDRRRTFMVAQLMGKVKKENDDEKKEEKKET